MAVGPMIGVHGKLPLDFGEAFLRAFSKPTRFGEFFNE
jgi:hypothetical protein